MSFISKTAAFIGLPALRDLVHDSIAIDMGSAATIIHVRGRGIVVDEPSVLALNNVTGEVIAFGREAQQMYGREARDVTVISPMLNGVVADFERTKQMLAHFVRQARGGVSYFSRRAIMGVYPGVTPVERRALMSAAEHARIGRILMIEEGLAAALGAGVQVTDPRGSAVVDIGGGTTNVAVVASGAIVHAHSGRIGSADINAAITEHVRRHRGLAIGAHTAERLKLELASATLPTDLAQELIIKGRDVVTGAPRAIEITAGEIYPIAQYVVSKIVEGVRITLEDLPPEVAGDIYERGIIITGGGALFGGIDHFLHEQTGLPIRIADEPRYAIVRGLVLMFDQPLWLRQVLRRDARPMVDAESEL